MIDITEWSKISQDSFKAFEFDSGMLVKNFDPNSLSPPSDEDIICSTTGNITASCVPTIANLGEDVNNLHTTPLELAYLQRWESTMSFTALEMNTKTFKLALGAADIEGNIVTPRMKLNTSDFQTIALVMRLVGGGLAAAVLSNALSTSGLSISTSKEGKGNLAITMTGFSSIQTQSVVPMKFYSIDATTVNDTSGV